MTLSILSLLVCAVLAVKLMFFTDEHRKQSRWYYRVLLFVVTVYDANLIIEFVYVPDRAIGIWEFLFQVVLLIGAFVIKPEYLPFNQPAEPKPQLKKVPQ